MSKTLLPSGCYGLPLPFEGKELPGSLPDSMIISLVIILLTMGCFLILPTTTYAWVVDGVKDCQDNSAENQINAKDYNVKSIKVLEDTYKKTILALDHENHQDAIKLLENSQKVWEKFRESESQFIDFLCSNGKPNSIGYNYAFGELSMYRSMELQSIWVVKDPGNPTYYLSQKRSPGVSLPPNRFTPEELRIFDDSLNTSYKKLLSCLRNADKPSLHGGDKMLRTSERLWLNYRKAESTYLLKIFEGYHLNLFIKDEVMGQLTRYRGMDIDGAFSQYCEGFSVRN